MQDIKMSDKKLPKGWKWSKIGDIVEMQSGMAFKKAEYSTEGVRLFQIANVSFNYTKWDDVEHLPIEYIESHNHLLLKKGDVVLALNRPMLNNQLKIAELKQSDVPAILYQRVGRFIFKESINQRYFLYYFQSFVFLKWLGEQLQGVNIPFINKSKLFSFDKFPLPPLETQQAIVSKIEELFSELDKGIEDLKTAQQQLKTYRQSVLKWAFEGKLTNDNVKDGELPKGWEMVPITKIVEQNKHALKAGPFGSSLKKEFYVPKGYKIYGQEQVISDNPFLGDYYVNEEKYQELKSCQIKPFDILISLVGTVGKVLVLPENCKEGIINPRLIKISLNREIYLPKFFKNYFESSVVKLFYSKVTKGTTMNVLNLGIIKTIPFPLPPIKEQHLIMDEIESRLSVADKMEESIAHSLLQAESLRQSILKKAFSGELV